MLERDSVVSEKEEEIVEEESEEEEIIITDEVIKKRIEIFTRGNGGKIESFSLKALANNRGEKFFFGRQPDLKLLYQACLMAEDARGEDNFTDTEYTMPDESKKLGYEYSQEYFRNNFYKIIGMQVGSGLFTYDEIKNNLSRSAEMYMENAFDANLFEEKREFFVDFEINPGNGIRPLSEIKNTPKLLNNLTGIYPKDPFRGFGPNLTNTQLVQIEASLKGMEKESINPAILIAIRLYNDIHNNRKNKYFPDPDRSHIGTSATSIIIQSKQAYKLEAESLEKLNCRLLAMGMKKRDLDTMLTCKNPTEMIRAYSETHQFKKVSGMNYEELKAMDPSAYKTHLQKYTELQSGELRLSSNNIRQAFLIYKITKDKYDNANIFKKWFSSKTKECNRMSMRFESILKNKLLITKEEFDRVKNAKPEDLEATAKEIGDKIQELEQQKMAERKQEKIRQENLEKKEIVKEPLENIKDLIKDEVLEEKVEVKEEEVKEVNLEKEKELINEEDGPQLPEK